MRMSFLTIAAFTIAVIDPFDQSACAQNEHSEPFRKCGKVCADCQLQCDSSFKHCPMLLSQGKKEHGRTAQIAPSAARHVRRCVLGRALSPVPCWIAARSAATNVPRCASSFRTINKWPIAPNRVGSVPENAARCSKTLARENCPRSLGRHFQLHFLVVAQDLDLDGDARLLGL
jgi:hypothetical protein